MTRRVTFACYALLLGQLATSSCAGPKFEPSGECDDDACEAGATGSEEQAGQGGSDAGVGGAAGSGQGGSAGRAGASGSPSAGKGGSGESGSGGDGAGGIGLVGGAGTPPLGGSAGSGVAGMGGVAGSDMAGAAGADPAAFPLTGVLDDFESAEAFDERWFGNVQDFTVADGVLTCVDCPHAALHEERLDADQEAHVTLAGFDANASEINLILLAQNEICELVEVLYSPVEQVLEVNTCYFGIWELHGSTSATLSAGDRFGARLHADGSVQVFVNGEERLSAAVGALQNDGGYIGVSGITPDPIVFDDFGGGEWR